MDFLFCEEKSPFLVNGSGWGSCPRWASTVLTDLSDSALAAELVVTAGVKAQICLPPKAMFSLGYCAPLWFARFAPLQMHFSLSLPGYGESVQGLMECLMFVGFRTSFLCVFCTIPDFSRLRSGLPAQWSADFCELAPQHSIQELPILLREPNCRTSY